MLSQIKTSVLLDSPHKLFSKESDNIGNVQTSENFGVDNNIYLLEKKNN